MHRRAPAHQVAPTVITYRSKVEEHFVLRLAVLASAEAVVVDHVSRQGPQDKGGASWNDPHRVHTIHTATPRSRHMPPDACPTWPAVHSPSDNPQSAAKMAAPSTSWRATNTFNAVPKQSTMLNLMPNEQ